MAIHAAAPSERRPFGLAGLVLTGAYVATIGANDLIQITTVRLNLTAGTTEAWRCGSRTTPMALYALAFPLGAALCAVVFRRLGQAAGRR